LVLFLPSTVNDPPHIKSFFLFLVYLKVLFHHSSRESEENLEKPRPLVGGNLTEILTSYIMNTSLKDYGWTILVSVVHEKKIKYALTKGDFNED